MREDRSGSIFLMALFVLTGLASIMAVGLSRTMTEQLAGNRYVATQQAFHLAEAGLDAKLIEFADANATNDGLNIAETPLVNGTYRVQLTSLSPNTWQVISTGSSAGTPHSIQAVVQLPPGSFKYTVATGNLDLQGNAKLGDQQMWVLGLPLELYIAKGYEGGNLHPLSTTLGNEVWATKIDFLNPMNQLLNDLCPDCGNFNIFKGIPPPQYNLNVPQTTVPPINFNPYYTRALQQQAIDGQSYHHITTDTTINGSNYPNGLDGIIYVEAGVDVTFTNTVVIRGTIVHEGGGITPSDATLDFGNVEMASGTGLRVLSSTPTNTFFDVDNDGIKDSPFAPGIAILGGGILKWPQSSALSGSPGIEGFVMAGSLDSSTTRRTEIKSDGTIKGGLLGVSTFATTQTGAYAFQTGVNGPGASEPVIFHHAFILPNSTTPSYGYIVLGGNARLTFQLLPGTPPGFPSSNTPQPIVLLWSN